MPYRFPQLAAALDDYLVRHPDEGEAVADFEAFLASHAGVFKRSHLVGHFTGSAWLVSADGERALLMHHAKLRRWLQLGGHADGDSELARVALREAEEESGLHALAVEPKIFDIDRHRITARADEPEPWHYDVRYVVSAPGSEAYAINAESLALAWKPVHEIARDPQADGSLRRMAGKWLARLA